MLGATPHKYPVWHTNMERKRSPSDCFSIDSLGLMETAVLFCGFLKRVTEILHNINCYPDKIIRPSFHSILIENDINKSLLDK